MKTKIIKIIFCKGCPFYLFHDRADYCKKKRNWLFNQVNNSIPEDCPLEDA